MTHPSLHTWICDQIAKEPASAQASDTMLSSSRVADFLAETSEENALNALERVLQQDPSTMADDTQVAHAILVGLIHRVRAGQPLGLPQKIFEEIRVSYDQSVRQAGFQSLILRCLIALQTPDSLSLFAQLVVSEPTLPGRFYLEIFNDLLKLRGDEVEALFPELLAGLQRPQLAPYVLDYSNYCFRHGLLTSHPASDVVTELVALLSNLAERLGAIQDTKPESDEQATMLGKQVTEAVSLGVSLCDALACIGDPSAIGSLNKALGVEHRRLRVEAAAALAKLDVEDAKSLLVAMAADPVERLRVLHYAEELDIVDRVEDTYCNIVARAEAEFVTYLSQPDQFGIAPQHVELVDQRELAWPGFEEPRNCYLFRFVYRFEMGEFSNLGIAGPLVKVFQADLRHLSFDDMYAIFAGWHVDHPEILALPVDRTVGNDQVNLTRMVDSLRATEYDEVRPTLFAKLLDQQALIASARRDEQDGWVVVTEDAVNWTPLGSPQSPLGAEDIFHLFVGQSLLRSFN